MGVFVVSIFLGDFVACFCGGEVCVGGGSLLFLSSWVIFYVIFFFFFF